MKQPPVRWDGGTGAAGAPLEDQQILRRVQDENHQTNNQLFWSTRNTFFIKQAHDIVLIVNVEVLNSSSDFTIVCPRYVFVNERHNRLHTRDPA